MLIFSRYNVYHVNLKVQLWLMVLAEKLRDRQSSYILLWGGHECEYQILWQSIE